VSKIQGLEIDWATAEPVRGVVSTYNFGVADAGPLTLEALQAGLGLLPTLPPTPLLFQFSDLPLQTREEVLRNGWADEPRPDLGRGLPERIKELDRA
jgi:hypothetical protein